jgi:large subunit ribosomal protein L15
MPLQRRLPKRGFKSLNAGKVVEIRLSELNSIAVDKIDLLVLKQAGLASVKTLAAKVILSGKIDRAVSLRGILVSAAAKTAIEAAGGSIE